MVDFSKSDKRIKISRKVDRSNTYNGFRCNISFFIYGRTSSDSVNEERNIATKLVVSI